MKHADTAYYSHLCPGPEPDNETLVSENPAFVDACMTAVSSYATPEERFGNSLLTHSDVWGYIFRIDFQSDNQTGSVQTSRRFLYWSAEEPDSIAGIALFPGHGLKPLGPDAG